MTLKLNATEGALPICIPRAPRVPSDLAALDHSGPDRWVAKIESAARRERSAWIAYLIAGSLAGQ